MGERESFIRAICEQPEEDSVRLVFADWLEEHGQPERAEFIRVQAELTQPFVHPTEWTVTAADLEEYAATSTKTIPEVKYDRRREWLRYRERELWEQVGGTRLVPLPIDLWRVEHAYDEHNRISPQLVRPGNHITESVAVARGFVSRVELPCEAFMRHAAELFKAHPITEVRLTDRHLYPNMALYRSHRYTDPTEDFGSIPPKVYRMWKVLPKSERRWTQIDGAWMYFSTQADADATLSALCVTYGREQAKLPHFAVSNPPVA